MATVLTRLLAALRGLGVPPALAGHERSLSQPQLRRVSGPAARLADAGPRSRIDRAVRLSEFRVRRMRQIAAFYAGSSHEVALTIGDCAFLPDERFQAAAVTVVQSAGEPSSSLAAAEGALRGATIQRRLGDLSDRERATLRAADLLCEVGEFERVAALRIRLPIVWNEGRCQITALGYGTATRRNFLKLGLETLLGEPIAAAPDGFERLRRAWRNALSLDAMLSKEEHQALESFQFIDRSWRNPPDPDPGASRAALSLGVFAGTDRDLLYDDPHGLITFAPEQSPRRHAQIAYNLARLEAGAVVIDIDGKAFHETARWRQREVGSILAFAPALAAHSMHYNPLDAIGRDPQTAWSEARLLADLLTGRRGPDEEARNLLAPAIYDVALGERPERRQMHRVIARIACSGPQLESWIETLARSPHPELARHSAVLRDMPEATLLALAVRVLRELEVWQSAPIADLIDRSDWSPADLRRRGTLYVCVERRDLDRYAPVLRTIIGQTITGLGRDTAISPGSTVTLLLDGLSHLGPMLTISRAVDIGPEAGVRPWMFFSSSAEMQAIYPGADGMIANCAAHCYIEPGADTAPELAQRLGLVKSLFGTDERPMVAAADLAGPEFAQAIIAIVRGHSPAKLTLPANGMAGPRER